MLPFRGGRAVYSPHYFFVFVASVFGKLIVTSGNQGSGDGGGDKYDSTSNTSNT
jgi:hypothetical protein